jgi:pyrroline-5-carboxylate reductase
MQIFLIGCGNMGGAIVSGMLRSKNFQVEQITAVLPLHSFDYTKVSESLKIKVIDNLPKDAKADIIIFAVKPQILNEILPTYQNLISESTLLVSICAGKTLKYFAQYFPKNKIVRTMPNLNAIAGAGSTVGVANTELSAEQNKAVEQIFKSIGSYTWIEDEKLIDPVTAISGSGPAYYFLFTELLAHAGEKLGLPKHLAEQLAQETFIGSGAILASGTKAPKEWREAVTSPKGTTAAALDTFNSDNILQKIIEDATNAASNRAKELAS